MSLAEGTGYLFRLNCSGGSTRVVTSPGTCSNASFAIYALGSIALGITLSDATSRYVTVILNLFVLTLKLSPDYRQDKLGRSARFWK